VSSGSILTVFLCCAAAELAWEAALTLLNMRHVAAHAAEVPPFYGELWARRGQSPPEGHLAKSAAYTLARSRLSLATQAFSSLLVVALVWSGALGALEGWLARALPGEALAGAAFVLCVGLLLQLAGTPFGYHSQFVLEARFGFNTMKPGLWVLDRLKGLLISLLIAVPLLLGLFWFVRRAGTLWWLYAAAAAVLVQAVLTLLYPALVAPLFNRFTPLAEGSLKLRVLELARRLGFGVRGILVMDASRRSRHSNAYFTGLGRAKRVVFYDTLIARTGEEEALAVLAHEIGHEKLGHIRLGLALSAVATVGGLWLLGLLLGWDAFFRAFGLAGPSTAGAVVVLAFCSSPFTFFLQPALSAWSRRREYAADRFARRAMGSGAPLVHALLDLQADNLSNLWPHPLYSFVNYGHPTLAERARALEAPEPPGRRGARGSTSL
jgi:STE24 endopeptidase